MAPPVQWGDEAIVRERFRAGISRLDIARRIAALRYPVDEAGTVELFRKYFGPTIRGFETLDAAGQAAYERDLVTNYKQHNRAKDGTTHVDSEYLEVVARSE